MTIIHQKASDILRLGSSNRLKEAGIGDPSCETVKHLMRVHMLDGVQNLKHQLLPTFACSARFLPWPAGWTWRGEPEFPGLC